MSMGITSRTQRRDKSATSQKQVQATAEQLRIAKIIDNNAEDIEMKNKVAKILEITGTTEDNARTALYDTNNDANRAIELILENGSSEQNSEWETAGRKKNKNAQQNNSGRNVDSFDDDFRDPSSNSGQWSRGESRGRGRGKNTRSRGKNFDPERANEDEGRTSESRDRQRGGGSRRGRGRGSGRGGRQPGRGPRQFKRFNNNRGSPPGGNQDQEFDSQFKSFTNSNMDPSQVNGDSWVNDNEEDWGKLEVGTWSNDEPQKEKKGDDSFSEGWGTGSWNDDLAQTKVFQAQSASLSGTLPPTTHISPTSNVGSQPQMGERIDIGALFTKTLPDRTTNSYGQANNSHVGYSNNGSTTHAPSVIQQLQQQGQSNSLFSDNKPANTDHEQPTSRLFGNFDRQSSNTSTNHTTSIGPYGSVVQKPDTSFSQYSGGETTENNGGSTLLGSFGEHFISQDQNKLLGDITKSAFTPLKPQSEAQVTASDYNNFSQAQQREATNAVKASLGLGQEQLESNTQGQGMSPSTLSFGQPLPTRQSKQQRRKPAAASSKIPASAVEMPGGSGGSTYQEVSSFDLQFGVDDNSGSQNVEFGVNTTQGSGAQNSLFSNNSSSSQQSMLLSHMPSANLQGGNLGDSNTMFPSQILNSSQQQSEARGLQRSAYQALQPGLSHSHNQGTVSNEGMPHLSQSESNASSLHNSQRYNEGTHKTGDTPLRGPPPGISHPQASTASNSYMGQQDDHSGGPGTFGQSRMGNLQESSMEPSSTLGSHSYYTSSTSLTQQSQQQDLQSSNGRSMRSPIPSSSLPGSLQSSPMPHISNTPSKDQTVSAPQGGMAAAHATPRVGATPTKLTTSGSTPINIPGPNSSAGQMGSGYGGINIDYSSTSSQLLNQQSSTSSAAPVAASPGSHLTSNELYSSSLHSHQPATSSAPSMQNIIGSSLGSTGLPSVNSAGNTGFLKHQSTAVSTASKAGPPNLPLGVPPILSNQYGIPMGPGLMTAYTPEQLYGYTDSLMAVPSRVVNQMPNYYDVSSFHSSNNHSANSSSHNRDSNVNQGKLNQRGGEASSPPSLGMIGSGLAQQQQQQQVQTGQHNQQQLKVSQTGSHQQPYMNLPTAGHAAYPYNSGLYYNAFQYPPMFTAAVPQNAKHSVNTTTAFQQPGTAFGNAYSTASMSSTSNLHDLQPQGYNKSHASAYEKQQATFHHHTNTPPPAFNLQTLTAAMAAANTQNGTAGAAPGMSPYTQAPFMTMLPTVPNHHQHSQIHLHLQHGDVGQSVGSQRSQTSNQLGKSGSKAPFGTTNNNTYWAS